MTEEQRVERVARALWRLDFQGDWDEADIWRAWDEATDEDRHFPEARAALAAAAPQVEEWRSFDDLPWRDGKDAPKDGTLIAGLRSMRWTTYKPGSEQVRRFGKGAGRWQQRGEYGGWENCDQPEQWLPHPPALLSRQQGESE